MTVTEPPPTYRFKFVESVAGMLYEFAKLHQYDDRRAYKEAWEEWLRTHEDDVGREERRLISRGYKGNVVAKMYKSGRYYFRTKPTDETEPRDRRTYVPSSQELTEAMDEHIRMRRNDPDYTPAGGYDDFCRSHQVGISREIAWLRDGGITDAVDISAKIKKTYKNRYFRSTQFARTK